MSGNCVAIVIPFVAWGALVEDCVEGCLAQDYDRYVVCLLPSSPATVPPRWASHPKVRVVPTPADGIAHKRNVGMQACPDADFYAFIDSDAIPGPDWLRQGVRAFGESESIWLVGGPDISPAYDDVYRRAVSLALRSVLLGGPRIHAKRGGADRDVDDLKTCNLFARADAMRVIGGFDERMEVGEDSALCQSVRRSGMRLVFRSSVCVAHHARRLYAPFVAQRITSGYGVPDLVKYYGASMGWWSIAFRYLPSAAVLYFVAGLFLVGIPEWIGYWVAGAVLYFAVVLVETVRWSKRAKDHPRVMAALVLGNLCPGVGTWLRVLGVRLQLSRFYRNDV